MASKTCNGCQVRKEPSEFSKRKGGDGLRSRCKPCEAVARRQAYAANPQRFRDAAWRAGLKKLYGITEAQYDEMLTDQGGVCAICGGGDTHRLSVDHNHSTGAVRSLLCRSCNTGLGSFREDPFLMVKAMDYLAMHNG